jgi:thioredoxin reductase/bacterioferritin-associated ferredoxin
MRETQFAIVGGGPAALSAAIQAAKLGVSSIILDENPQLGGQIYRQPASAFKIQDENELGKHYRDGKRILAEVQEYSDKIEVNNDALVWGYFDERKLTVLHNGKSELLKAHQLLIATGAYDRPIPFPGWTLPGVFTAGGVQVMIKSQRLLPGSRFLLAGSGPLQLALADQLLDAGAKILAVVDATSTMRMMRYLPSLLRRPGLVYEGFSYLTKLRRRGIPYLRSHVIIRASGNEHVEQAVIASLDENGKPLPGSERTFDVDAICLGYGLVPNIDLTKLCGCAHEYNHAQGGWRPTHNEHMETCVPGVFVAGDGCGIAGVHAAIQQGKLAGIYAASNLGLLDIPAADKMAKPIRSKLSTLMKFATALGELYSLGNMIYSLSNDDTVICRCEEITFREIREAIHAGAVHVDDIKRRTRSGMGYCQGRICGPSLLGIAGNELNVHTEAAGHLKGRLPIKPVPLTALLDL